MAKKEWRVLLDNANKELEQHGVQLKMKREDNTYELDEVWKDGATYVYAQGYYEDELPELIREARLKTLCKSFTRGDKVIRVELNVDTGNYEESFGDEDYVGSWEAALWWMNEYVHRNFPDAPTLKSVDDLPALNAMLAEKFIDPNNEKCYARMDDVKEKIIIKCSEVFCEHHWSCDALVEVADELGVLWDLDK